jgi:hypothetical protein
MSVPTNFLDWLQRQIDDYRAQFSLASNGDAFACWALAYSHEISPDDAFNQSDTLAQGDGSLDGYHLDKEAELFYLSQSKYLNNPEGIVGPEPLRSFFSVLDLLISPEACAIRGTKIANIGQTFRDAIASGCRPVLQFFIAGRVSSETRKELEARAVGHTLSPLVEFWTLDRIYGEYLNREASRDLKDESISLSIFGNQYFMVSEPAVEGISSAMVANLDAACLAQQASLHMPQIVAANVRYHLGHQNRVNRGIRDTLANEDERKGFWYYNNGITIVCDSFDPPSNGVVRVTNPQIVNGCQTVTALIERRSSLDGVALPLAARIISRTKGEAGALQLLKIAEHTNSQSPVKQEDLKSNDRVQVELQIHFDSLPQPWFYERKRREWHSLLPAERKRYKTSHRVTKEDIGQRWRAYAGKPAQAVAGKEDMFAAPLYGEIYRSDRDVRLYLLAHLLYADYWDLLNQSNEELRAKLLPSFNERLLNRVLRGKKLWVMHCLYLMKELLALHYETIDGDKAEQIIRVLEEEPRQLDSARKIVLIAFRQWAAAIGDDGDMRAALQEPTTAAKWHDNLIDVVSLIDDLAQRLPKFP